MNINWRGILDDLRKPSSIITALSLIFALWVWLDSRQIKQIAYEVTEPVTVFDSEAASPAIQIFAIEGDAIASNVYATQITIWNSGELAIEPEDVRVPVTLYIGNIKRLLDIEVVKEYDPGVANIRAEGMGYVAPSGATANCDRTPRPSGCLLEVQVTWEHLDPQFGARIQVLYESNEPATVDFGGSILGMPRLVTGTEAANRYSLLGLSPLLLSLGAYLIGPVLIMFIALRMPGPLRALLFILVAIATLVYLTVALTNAVENMGRPPF